MKSLILIGGGGHCKSVIDVAESAGYNIHGILDNFKKRGDHILAYPVIGTDEDIPSLVNLGDFVITVGHIKSDTIRRKIADKVYAAKGHFATIIASDACVSKYASIEEGTVIMHKAVVNADAKIGKHCIINTMVNIEHDVRIGNFCHISTGAMINGEAIVGDDVFIGSNSEIHNCKVISNNIVIAAGSVIYKDLDKEGIYAGNPIKYYGK